MRTYLTLFLFALMSIQPGAEESKNSSGRFSEDLAELPAVAGLADPLISDEGSKITSREDWRARRKKLIDSLETSLKDAVKARELLPDGHYQHQQSGGRGSKWRSQEMQYRLAVKQARKIAQAKPTVFEPHLPIQDHETT